MRAIAVLGAGHGAAAAAAEFARRGLEIRLWNRSTATIEPFRAAGGIRYEGALGSGVARLAAVTESVAEAVEGVDAILVCVPALAHELVAGELARVAPRAPVILSPGHTGGALHVSSVIRRSGAEVPSLAELSTLPYVCRKSDPATIRVFARARHLRVAALPGGEPALRAARELYPQAEAQRDVLATGLADPNLVLHPPGAVLGASWIEATGGDYRFYADGTTPGVARVIERLDAERRAVARAFGHDLPALIDEMALIGTAEAGAARAGDVRAAIAGNEWNATISAPDSLEHRYFREDMAYGIVPLLALAAIAEVELPLARALLTLAETATGEQFGADGLTAQRLGIAGLDRDALLATVRAGAAAGAAR